MQEKSYTDLLALIQSLIGAGELTTDEQAKILNFVNRRAFEAYNTSPSWSRYIVSSEARDLNSYTLTGATASTSTSVNQNYVLLGTNDGNVGESGTNIYQGVTTSSVIIYKNASSQWIVATGATVAIQSDGRYRVTVAGTTQFTEADTLKKSLLEDVEVFTPRGGSDVLNVDPKNLIPYAETGLNTIGEFIRLHRKRAFLNNSSIEYDFFVDSTGANILNITSNSDNKAFVTYKKQMTEFTETSVDIPLEFFYFLAHAAFADFLRLESKYQDARTEEAIAQTYLAQELEKIDLRSNNNSLNHKFSTYVNRQSR
jgi:hypothetical protein